MFRIPIRIFFLIYSIAIPVRIIDVDLPAAIFHNIFFLTKKKQISLDFHRKNIFVQKKYRFSDRQIYLSRKQSSSSFSSCSTTPETPQVIFLPPEVQNFNSSFQIWENWSLFSPASYLSISIHLNHHHHHHHHRHNEHHHQRCNSASSIRSSGPAAAIRRVNKSRPSFTSTYSSRLSSLYHDYDRQHF